MTDNEIIKALECCASDDYVCKICPMNKFRIPDTGKCISKILRDTLDLINRQKAEILELQKRIINWRADMDYRPDEIKSEAIKEFGHFVIDRSKNGVICTSDIPDLVKEMTEVETNQRKEDEGK